MEKTYAFREHMTNEMKAICDNFHNQERLKKEFLEVQEKYNEVCDVLNRMILPMKNEEGIDVVHGCRLQLVKIKDYYQNRRYWLEQFIVDNKWISEQDEKLLSYRRRGVR